MLAFMCFTYVGGDSGFGMGMKHKSWVQPSEAADYFGVPPATIREWVADGKLRAATLPTGHLRILARDVVRCLLEQGKAVPPELGTLENKHVLILDADRDAAESLARALRQSGGCKATVADSAANARGLLNGIRPDLVLLGIRHAAPGHPKNGDIDMLVLAGATDDPPPWEIPAQGAAFRVSDILPCPVGNQVVVSRVANVLLG